MDETLYTVRHGNTNAQIGLKNSEVVLQIKF